MGGPDEDGPVTIGGAGAGARRRPSSSTYLAQLTVRLPPSSSRTVSSPVSRPRPSSRADASSAPGSARSVPGSGGPWRHDSSNGSNTAVQGTATTYPSGACTSAITPPATRIRPLGRVSSRAPARPMRTSAGGATECQASVEGSNTHASPAGEAPQLPHSPTLPPKARTRPSQSSCSDRPSARPGRGPTRRKLRVVGLQISVASLSPEALVTSTRPPRTRTSPVTSSMALMEALRSPASPATDHSRVAG
ncbi:MAG: hypothetical protein U0Q15_13875 [Kineosporiaceae bacterium]